MNEQLIPYTNRYAKKMNGHKSYSKATKKAFNEISVLGFHIISCKQYLSFINNNYICLYANNRGKKGIIESHVDDLVDEFDWDNLGTFTLAYDPTNNKLITADGSHRTLALCQLAVDGMLENNWHEEVAFKVVSVKKFYSTYVGINRGLNHKVIDILSNENLVYGRLISQLISLAEAETGMESPLRSQDLTVIAYLIYSLFENRNNKASYIRNWSYENVCSQNSKAAAIDWKKPIPKVTECTVKDILELAEGLCVVFNYITEYNKERKKAAKDFKEIIFDARARGHALSAAFPAIFLSGGMIGYLLCAGSREDFKLSQDADSWITDILSKGSHLTKIMGRKKGLADNVDFSKLLDKSIFGTSKLKISKRDIRYWPQLIRRNHYGN